MKNSIAHSSHPVKPDKWGKDIIILTWRFVIQLWSERNKIEHSMEDKTNAMERKRMKLILKIIWMHGKNKEYLQEFGEVLTIEELEKLPLSNLMMMESQFKLMKKRNKFDIDLLYGDQGESQP
jgi:hypothetical protein